VDDVTERLRLIESMKTFCTDYLGLVPNNSFTKIVNQNAYYIIGISPKDKIEKINRYGQIKTLKELEQVINP